MSICVAIKGRKRRRTKDSYRSSTEEAATIKNGNYKRTNKNPANKALYLMYVSESLEIVFRATDKRLTSENNLFSKG